MTHWLEVRRGNAPLVIGLPHTGTEIPDEVADALVSPWLARRDTDWSIDRLYAFAADMGATIVRTRISRSVIDVNRDPSGASLYPGQATTELCPSTTFDGDPLYHTASPDAAEVARRRAAYFDPYHATLSAELDRLRAAHGRVVLYDAHSIRSRVPRLFDGELPQFNIGTDRGLTCDSALEAAVVKAVAGTGHSFVVNGRFRGGWTTRHYGRPAEGYHAIQMELAIRSYLSEPETPTPANWPPAFDPATPLIDDLRRVIAACLSFDKDAA